MKVNQIGTLTEAFETMELAGKNGYRFVVSHRSGETEDTTIADIAVASEQARSRPEHPAAANRTAKYNRLLRIEDFLGGMAKYGVDNLSFLC